MLRSRGSISLLFSNPRILLPLALRAKDAEWIPPKNEETCCGGELTLQCVSRSIFSFKRFLLLCVSVC